MFECVRSAAHPLSVVYNRHDVPEGATLSHARFQMEYINNPTKLNQMISEAKTVSKTLARRFMSGADREACLPVCLPACLHAHTHTNAWMDR